jgi:hypothetical protein
MTNFRLLLLAMIVTYAFNVKVPGCKKLCVPTARVVRIIASRSKQVKFLNANASAIHCYPQIRNDLQLTFFCLTNFTDYFGCKHKINEVYVSTR